MIPIRLCFSVLLGTIIVSHVCSQIPTPVPPSRNIPFAPNGIPPSESQFRVVYEWRTIDFAFRTDELRVNALNLQDYIPKNNLISDIKAFANRLYVSVPRMLPGVPATLGYIIAPDNNGRTDPEIEPFPSWEMNQRGNCSALQFVQGLAIDAYGILWAVDSGRTETLLPGRGPTLCGPKLMLFDLKRNGTMVHRYDFPEEVVARNTNYLNKIVIDDAFGGFAYITDNSGADPGIVVFSRQLNTSWKLREDNSMRAAINAVAFAVNGTNLNFSIHIDGIAIGPYYNPNVADAANGSPIHYNENYERNIYYSPLSSYHLYSIPASVLRNQDFARTATPRQVLETVTDHGVKISQTDGMIMDDRGNLYYGLLKEHAIAQWDSYKPFTLPNQRIVAKDDAFIQWTDGMTFDDGGHLYVVVNRLHNFVAGRLDPGEVNFRVLRATTGTFSYVNTAKVINNAVTDTNSGPLFEGADGSIGLASTTPFFSPQSSLRGYNSAATGLGSGSSNAFYVIAITVAPLLVASLLHWR